MKQRIINYAIMTVASFIYAAAVSLFLDPNSLAPGGVTGVAIILNRIVGMETGTLILVLNVPVMLLGIWKFGLRFIVSSIYCTVLISFYTNWLEPFGAMTNDPLLASLAGSSLLALSLGWVFKAGGTTGGMDIIVKVLRQRLPHLRTGFLFLWIDTMIVAASAFLFRDIDKALYAGLVVCTCSFLLDIVLYGRDEAKLIYIISDHSERITKRLLDELAVGVTHMQGSGAYSGKEKNIIMCAVKKLYAPKAEEIVKQEDPMAFMIVTSASEIYGVGYKSYFSEKM